MGDLLSKIEDSLKKFKLDIKGKKVLTEAATGNYALTAVIGGLAGADVYALSRDSRYGTAEAAGRYVDGLTRKLNLKDSVRVIADIEEAPRKSIDIVTNTGHLRPIGRDFIARLSPECVIPLMYEPWEYRKDDLDLEACIMRGIKVYGTNEDDERLKTVEYLGGVASHLLSKNGIMPSDSDVLVIGSERFVEPVFRSLKKAGYSAFRVTAYPVDIDIGRYSAIIVLEHERDLQIVGGEGAVIKRDSISAGTLVINICGNTSFENAGFRYIPAKPRPFKYMNFTADYLDKRALIDLATAGLKVGEGMLEANRLRLKGAEYRRFMEENYPAAAFKDERFW